MEVSTKLVNAVNVMVRNQALMTQALDHLGTYYFIYNGKYRLSIHYSSGYSDVTEESWEEYALTYYPGDRDLSAISEGATQPSVRFSTNSLKTREAFESFRALYELLGVKVHDVEKVLDDISRTDAPF